MLRIVLLIAIFMVVIFTIVTNLAARTTGGEPARPLQSISKGISSIFNGAGRIVPGLSRAVDRIDMAAPTLGFGQKTALNAAFEPLDLTDQDRSGLKFAGEIYVASLLTRTQFINGLLDGVSFEGAHGDAPDFRKTGLRKSNFTAAAFRRPNFSDADLTAALARGASFDNGDFTRAIVNDASFSGSSLIGANFAGAFAVKASFTDARLARSRFDGADLRSARFVRTDATEVSFKDADVTQADFRGAFLGGADFTGAKGVDTANFSGACINAATKLETTAILSVC